MTKDMKKLYCSVFACFFAVWLMVLVFSSQAYADTYCTVKAKISKASVAPGEEVTIALALDGYANSTDSIGTIQISFPSSVSGLKLVDGTKTALCESGEWSSAKDVNMFVFLPDDFHTLSRDTTNLFSFKMKADESVSQSCAVYVPFTVTIGNQDDRVYGNFSAAVLSAQVNIIVNGSNPGNTGQGNASGNNAQTAGMQDQANGQVTDASVQTVNAGESLMATEVVAENDIATKTSVESNSTTLILIIGVVVVLLAVVGFLIYKNRVKKAE